MRQLGHKRAQQCTCLLQRGRARRSSLVHGKYFSRLPLQVASTLHSSESSVSNFQKILTNLAWYQRYLVSVGIRDFFIFQNSCESSLVFRVNFCVLVQDTCFLFVSARCAKQLPVFSTDQEFQHGISQPKRLESQDIVSSTKADEVAERTDINRGRQCRGSRLL